MQRSLGPGPADWATGHHKDQDRATGQAGHYLRSLATGQGNRTRRKGWPEDRATGQRLAIIQCAVSASHCHWQDSLKH